MRRTPSPFIAVVIGLLLLAVIFTFLRGTIFQGGGEQVPAVPTAAANDADGVSAETNTHTVQAGENLTAIASRYGVSLDALVAANSISNPNIVQVGTRLVIPDRSASVGIAAAPAETARTVATPVTLSNLIPDSELVYGPSMRGISVDSLVPANSYLRRFSESVEDTRLDGVEIVELVANRTRVNPRLLLAALEYKSGWVTLSNPATQARPLGSDIALDGLYRQLEWVANKLNLGYYAREEIGLAQMQLADGTTVAFDPTFSNGTAGVQLWLGAQPDITFNSWQQAASDGTFTFIATYRNLFGDPFQYADDDFWSTTVQQPALMLPWERGETWHLTGGPHGGWISGSAWAALDFVPGEDSFGCYESEQRLAAVADGVVVRSEFGALELDLDGDGYSGTGWVILYQHVATRDRLPVGTRVERGAQIGRASCEGGFSTGTHLHIARMYNGRWVSADSRTQPFNLGGWIASGSGSEYNGVLTNGVSRIVAEAARIPANAITNP